jgi:hypothetical protein
MSDFSSWIEKNRVLWTRVYNEVIAPDFEGEWKKSVYVRMMPYHFAKFIPGDEAHQNEMKQSV